MVPGFFETFTHRLLYSRASGTAGTPGTYRANRTYGEDLLVAMEGKIRGVIWMGIVSDEQELIPTVGF